MSALFVFLIGLALPGLLPALFIAGSFPVVPFLSPLIGAVMVAVAAELEVAIDGSLVDWYVGIVIVVNLIALAAISTRRGKIRSFSTISRSSFLAPLCVGVGLIVPLTGLRSPMFGYDANAIWLTHALMISGGHGDAVSYLQNISYRFSNPDYPPLMPAAEALSLLTAGPHYLHAAIDVAVLLNASAVGAVGLAVTKLGVSGARLTRAVAIVLGAGLCLVCFAVAGDPGIDGYADLLWAAAATAAVLWGLVLPTTRDNLAVAITSVMVASLTKNEGFTTAIILVVLMTLRYRRPIVRSLSSRLTFLAARGSVRRAYEGGALGAFVVIVLLPSLLWVGLVRHLGIQDAFFSTTSTESTSSRLTATLHAVVLHLAIAPAAIVVMLLGCCFYRRFRTAARLGHPAWLWAVAILSLGVIGATYVFGAEEIHWWLSTSISRTMIFTQLVLYSDLAVWAVIAVDAHAATRIDNGSSVNALTLMSISPQLESTQTIDYQGLPH